MKKNLPPASTIQQEESVREGIHPSSFPKGGTMPPSAMTEEQRLFYEANGFLILPNALSPEELATVRAAADRAEALWRAENARPGMRNPNLEQIQAPIEYDPALLALLAHPKVFPIVWEILGDDVSMIDNDLFLSPPRTQSHAAWHHDVGM